MVLAAAKQNPYARACAPQLNKHLLAQPAAGPDEENGLTHCASSCPSLGRQSGCTAKGVKAPNRPA